MPIDFPKLQLLFQEAIEKYGPESWVQFAEEICEDNAELCLQLKQLLSAHQQGSSALDSPPADIEVTDISPISEQPGDIIGPYKLLQQIGEGGFGVVYMAEQTKPVRRKVALKIIKPGMDTKEVIARFEAERQALALMDHPNIAKVLDAGATESGRPYFVMELVKGVPLTEYCDKNHLTGPERLKLFVNVCHAIQHAHQKGVIHRDLKPSNIMVTLHDGKPVPKVIDFGVSKALSQQLTEKTLFTAYGQMIGTPAYMSPEQAEMSGLDIDTRSDVYSLGVLLYELLTGSTPFDGKRLRSAGYAEMQRIIREEEPIRPSTRLTTLGEESVVVSANRGSDPKKLGQLVRGDLDWIVMKALDKERNRRYETANGFVADIERFLNDEPVEACPPSTTYRFRKFARRNKTLIGTSVTIAVALMMVVASLGWAIRDRSARKQQALREKTEQQSRLADHVNLILEQADRLVGEKQWKEALATAERAEAAIQVGEPDPATRTRVEAVLSDLKLVHDLEQARLLEIRFAEGKWNRAGACEAYARTFDEAGLSLDGDTVKEAATWSRNRERILSELVVALTDWARLQRKPEAKDEHTEGPDVNWRYLLDVADAADPDRWRHRLRTAYRIEESTPKVLEALAQSVNVDTLSISNLVLLGRLLEDRLAPDAVAEFLLKVHQRHPGDFWINYQIGNALSDPKLKRFDEAILYYSMAMAIRPDNVNVLNNLGVTLHDAGRIEEAIAVLRRAIEKDDSWSYLHTNLAGSLTKLGHYEEGWEHGQRAVEIDPEFAGPYCVFGIILQEQGKLDEAIAEYRKAIELDPEEPWYTTDLGSVLLKQNKPEEAIACFHRAIEADPLFPTAHLGLGIALKNQGKLEDAIPCVQRVIELDSERADAYQQLGYLLWKQGRLKESVTSSKTAIKLDPLSVPAHVNLGTVLEDQRKLEDALVCFQRALELDPDVPEAYNGLGNVFSAQGKVDAAIAKYRKAIELAPEDALYHTNLGLALGKQNKQEEAIACYRRAIELDPDFALAHHALGYALSKQGDIEQALDAWRKAVELDPEISAADDFVWHIVRFPDRPQAEYEEALEIAKQQVEQAPESGQTLRNLGIAQFRNQHWNEAASTLEKYDRLVASKGDVQTPVQEVVCAMTYWQLGRREEARDLLNLGIVHFEVRNETNPERLAFRNEAELLLGLELSDADRQELALQYASRELKQDPDDKRMLKWRANAYIDREAWQAAADDLSRLIELKPKDFRSHATLARVCRKLKQYERAIEACNTALELDPKNAAAYFNRGEAYLQQKKYAAALADFEKSIKLNSDFPWTYQKRGYLYAEQREWAKALADLHIVQQLLPERRQEFSKAIALVMLAAGENENYRRLCEKLLSEYEQTSDPKIAQTLLDCALLAPDALASDSTLIELASAKVSAHPDDIGSLVDLGAAHYRAGDIASALAQFEENHERGKSGPRNWAWLALARRKTGQADQANQLIKAVGKWLSNNPDAHWAFRFEIELLRQEAEHLFNAPKKGVASEKPETTETETP